MNEANKHLDLLPEEMDLGAACMISDMVPTGGYGAELADIRSGNIVEQILDLNHGPVDKIIVAGGGNDTFDQAVRMLMKDRPRDLMKHLVIV